MNPEQFRHVSDKHLIRYATISVITIFVISRIPIPTTYAQEAQLQITPSNIYIEANPPADPRATFTIRNNSERSISLDIGYKVIDKDKSMDGKVVPLANPSPEDETFLRQVQVIDQDNVTYNSIELAPQQEKTLQLRVILPKNQLEHDYYFSLIFLEEVKNTNQNISKDNENNQAATSTLISGIGLNTFVSIGPKEEPEVAINKFHTAWFHQLGPIPFTITLRNLGLHYARPKGIIVIKNMFGKTVGKVPLPAKVLLPGAEREIFSHTTEPVLWDNRFLLGSYQAELELQNSKGEIITSQSMRFIAVPLFLFLGIAGIIAGGVFIYRRVKRRI